MANATFGNSGSLSPDGVGCDRDEPAPVSRRMGGDGGGSGRGGLLMGRSLELGSRTLAGDLFSVAGGAVLRRLSAALQHARASLGNWSLLFWASLAGLPVILPCALAMGEPFWPGTHGGHWWPLIVLAMGSQVVGQGLLVYALRHFTRS
jgi:drug/metabolite transporter (DMT)-like permease